MDDDSVRKGLAWSFVVCVVALFVSGFGKKCVLGYDTDTRKEGKVMRSSRGRIGEGVRVGGHVDGCAGERGCWYGGVVCEGF